MERVLDFKIYGMDCADEVQILKHELKPLVPEESRLAFDVLRGRLRINAEGLDLDSASIQRAVAASGMRAEEWQDVQPDAAERSFWQRRGRTVLTAISGVATAAGVGVHVAMSGVAAVLSGEVPGAPEQTVPLPAIVAYTIAIVSGGWYVAPRGWHAIRRLSPDMNLLMTIAVLGAVAIGEWFEAATVSFLFAVSLALESWSVGRARRAVEALLALAPATVRVLRDAKEQTLAPADVAVGEQFIVWAGERIPLDGVVRDGESDVDQAPITGESVPVAKSVGSEVFAGTINGNGRMQVEATRLAGETTLAQIIRMVGDAQSRRAPSEQWVDRFARVYTPAVLAAAVIGALVPLVTGGSWDEWTYRALVLLVVGCPCALVISTPVSVVAALASSARHGVLVKGGVHIETPARLRVIAVDKTGTLTRGRPAVKSIHPLSGHSEQELLELAGALEAHSDHPLAIAVTGYVRSRSVAVPAIEGFQVVPGKGAVGRINGQPYWLGSHRLLEERGQETPEVHAEIERLSSAGHTIVIVGTDDHVCGFIALADELRPEARAAVQALRAAGIERVIMLTGDNRGTGEAIGREAGVDEVRAELLPADKVQAVEELVRKYGAVAMVGDGINDAPALGRATLGIAMGAVGTDAAIEAGDVALMSDDLSKVAWLVRHSRRTLNVIRQNIILSIGVKALFVVLTFAGFASLWAAIAADMGVSLLVIANALRLLRNGSTAS